MITDIRKQSGFDSALADQSVQSKITELRAELKKSYAFINRLAVALYNPERNVLHTYAYDEDNPSNIYNYEASFKACRSLVKLAEHNQERVVNNLRTWDKGYNQRHTELIKKAGFYSSFTMPLIINGELLGFCFANSYRKDVFSEEAVRQLKLISSVLALTLHYDLSRVKALQSTVKTMSLFCEYKDPETAEHLQRMSRYALLIAKGVADKFKLIDTEIRYIYLYSALHDIGKVSIPDNILFKPSRLTESEFTKMKEHPINGEALVKRLIELYHFEDMPHIQILLDIIRCHHEKNDGSGYPDGLKACDIPVAAKIVMVADIFDALTSHRPYKPAWSNEVAFSELLSMCDQQLDRDCVNVLINNKQTLRYIQEEFADQH